MSGIEGNLLMTGNWEAAGESGDPNMAEYHLSWWNGFSECWNYDLEPYSDTGSGTPEHNGGDYKIFAAYMSRLDGSIRESDAPGDNSSRIPTQSQCPLSKDTYRRWYVPDIDWFFIDGDGGQGSLQNIDTIKNVVKRNGVMPTNYLVGSSYMQDWNGYRTHYQPPSSSGDANHSVAIVGWHDDCNTRASEDGAWLCKNSWGSSQSYFYISYYDKHCCRNPEMSVVAFKNVIPLPYAGVYYHDYHGWRDTLSSAKDGFNKFVVENDADEYLVAVSFITTVDHEEYTVKIYDKFVGGELQDELASATGTITHMGYHTRDLSRPVTLKDGDDFYIYVGFKDGFQAYDRTCSPPVLTLEKPRAYIIVWSKAETDQSYYRTSPTGAWTDLYDLEESIVVYDGSNSRTVDCQGSQNLCIKGYVLDTMPVSIYNPDANIPQTRFSMYNYPNPFASQTTIKYALAEKGAVTLGIYNARGRLVRSLVKSSEKAGSHQISWNGKDEFNNTLSSGIYYSILTVKTNRGIATEKRKLFLVK
jgi:hypothetical protein